MNDWPFEEQISILHGFFFFLVRDGVQYPRIFAIHSRINHFTQEILALLPKKLLTPYSLIMIIKQQSIYLNVPCHRARWLLRNHLTHLREVNPTSIVFHERPLHLSSSFHII